MIKNHCYFRQFLVKTTFFYILTLMTDPNFDEIPAYIPKKERSLCHPANLSTLFISLMFGEIS